MSQTDVLKTVSYIKLNELELIFLNAKMHDNTSNFTDYMLHILNYEWYNIVP